MDSPKLLLWSRSFKLQEQMQKKSMKQSAGSYIELEKFTEFKKFGHVKT